MTKFSMEGEEQEIAVSVPLFLRKLWKMVNDQEAENIIGWNSTGDGFVIYDQLQFIIKLLPKYFKHNNMASFIRQLNFYDFHKVAGIDKDEIQFTHNCFLKDLPETLVFIKRKCTTLRSKLASNLKEEEINEIFSGVKELKTKHTLVDNELKMLKQENAALWNEVNNLRLKHAKQTKIINKIIHFLISYMHSHQNLSKGKMSVGRTSPNIKTGPTILEIDYHNNPTSGQKDAGQKSFTGPSHGGAITYPSSELDSYSNMQPAERTLDEILDKVGATIKQSKQSARTSASTLTSSKLNVSVNEKPSSSKESNVQATNMTQDIKAEALENSNDSIGVYSPGYEKKQVPPQKPVKFEILHSPREHLGRYLNNTQLEIDSLQDMLNNLNSAELANICNILECSGTEESKELDNPNWTNIYEDMADERATSGDDNLLGNDVYIQNSDGDAFVTLPMEANTVNEEEQYSASLPIPSDMESRQDTEENMDDIEADALANKYFAL